MNCILAFVLFCGIFFHVQGDAPAVQYYEELKCKPIIEAGESQPSRYDCSHLNQMKSDSCYLNGRQYKDGESVDQSDLKDECTRACYCRVDEEEGRASFHCAHVDCPQYFTKNNGDGNCYMKAKWNACCYEQHCDDTHGSERATCEYNGTTYKEGQKFYPDDQACTACICDKDFNGSIQGPWCQKFGCNLFVHYGERIKNGCAPTYYNKEDCCPIPTWRCPEENDVIIGESTVSPKSDDHVCVWGDKKLAVGQRLEAHPSEECVECSCVIPPLVTCVMNVTCYRGD